jgi:pyridoxamine 5'-phosphate oxidase
MDLDDPRSEFEARSLRRADLDSDPIAQFGRWFDEVAAAGLHQPEAMVVATVDSQGRPSARQVLLRGVDTGFVFFSNYRSRKGREVEGNAHVALVFTWNELSRQVRITGDAHRLSASESDEYWTTRPRGSQLAALASEQSQVIADRDALEARWAELTAEHDGREVPRPEWWGGYRVVPREIEFWQGRPNRMHDRFRYAPAAGEAWQIDRLSP